MDLSPTGAPARPEQPSEPSGPPQHVLVIGPGRDFPARFRAHAPGTRTTVMCQLGYVHRVRGYAEHARVIAVHGDAPDAEWVDLAAAVHARDPFTAIATLGERDQDHYAAVADALGLPSHSPATVALVHDKRAMRARLAEIGVDTTPSARVEDVAGLAAFVGRHGLPVVVKPVSSSGSAGVTKVTGEDQLEAAFARAVRSYLDLPNPGALVETFLDGPEVSVEAFSEDGEHVVVSVTGKFKDPATFVELGHVAPAELHPSTLREVERYVAAVLDALGVRFGPTHTEVVLQADGPRVIETHVRVGGDDIPRLTHDATGVDLDDLTVRQLLGERVLPGLREHLAGARPEQGAAIWFATAPHPGTVVAVSGAEPAAAAEGVVDLVVGVEPGAVVGELESSQARIASARAVAPTAGEAVERARAALALLGVEVERVSHAEEDAGS